jgi:hypothetical protein
MHTACILCLQQIAPLSILVGRQMEQLSRNAEILQQAMRQGHAVDSAVATVQSGKQSHYARQMALILGSQAACVPKVGDVPRCPPDAMNTKISLSDETYGTCDP